MSAALDQLASSIGLTVGERADDDLPTGWSQNWLGALGADVQETQDITEMLVRQAQDHRFQMASHQIECLQKRVLGALTNAPGGEYTLATFADVIPIAQHAQDPTGLARAHSQLRESVDNELFNIVATSLAMAWDFSATVDWRMLVSLGSIAERLTVAMAPLCGTTDIKLLTDAQAYIDKLQSVRRAIQDLHFEWNAIVDDALRADAGPIKEFLRSQGAKSLGQSSESPFLLLLSQGKASLRDHVQNSKARTQKIVAGSTNALLKTLSAYTSWSFATMLYSAWNTLNTLDSWFQLYHNNRDLFERLKAAEGTFVYKTLAEVPQYARALGWIEEMPNTSKDSEFFTNLGIPQPSTYLPPILVPHEPEIILQRATFYATLAGAPRAILGTSTVLAAFVIILLIYAAYKYGSRVGDIVGVQTERAVNAIASAVADTARSLIVRRDQSPSPPRRRVITAQPQQQASPPAPRRSARARTPPRGRRQYLDEDE